MIRVVLVLLLALSSVSGAIATPKKPLTLAMVIDNACVVHLSDGSVWEVRPENRPKAAKWKSNSKIAVYRVEDRDFPFRLIIRPGDPTGEVVAVKRLIRYR